LSENDRILITRARVVNYSVGEVDTLVSCRQ